MDTWSWKGAGGSPTFLGGIVWFVPLTQRLLSIWKETSLLPGELNTQPPLKQGSKDPGLPEGPEPGRLGRLGGFGPWDRPSPPAWARSRWLLPGPSLSRVQVGCWKRGCC